MSGYTEVVALLLQHGVDVHAKSNGQLTALDFATAGGFKEVMDLLIKAGASKDTLLFQAIKLNKLTAVGHLLQHFALSLDLVDSKGRSVVQVAVDHWIAEGITEGVEECLRQFSEHLAVRRMLNSKNKDGDTPIIQLLKHGRVDLVNVLLESPEIDLDVRDSAGKNLEAIAR